LLCEWLHATLCDLASSAQTGAVEFPRSRLHLPAQPRAPRGLPSAVACRSGAPVAFLLEPQRHHRVHSRCTPRRNVTGGQGNPDQHQRNRAANVTGLARTPKSATSNMEKRLCATESNTTSSIDRTRNTGWFGSTAATARRIAGVRLLGGSAERTTRNCGAKQSGRHAALGLTAFPADLLHA